MDKLLTNRDRTWFSLILMAAAMLIMAGLIPQHTKIPISDFWKQTGIVMQFIGIFTIMGAAIYAGTRITSVDLYGSLLQQLPEDEVMVKAYQTLQTKQLKFAEMSRWEKTGYVFFIFAAVSFWVYAAFDTFGWFPLMKVRTIDGTWQTFPRWSTVLAEILVGFVCLLMAYVLFTFKITDRWEERFKELLKEVENDSRKGFR